MSCPDWAFLSPLLKKSAVFIFWGPQGPQAVKREILMAEPDKFPPCLSVLSSGVWEESLLFSQSPFTHVWTPTNPISCVLSLLQEFFIVARALANAGVWGTEQQFTKVYATSWVTQRDRQAQEQWLLLTFLAARWAGGHLSGTSSPQTPCQWTSWALSNMPWHPHQPLQLATSRWTLV